MEQPQEKIDKKLKISEARAEITSIKKSMFQQASVMRGDNLRAYLDKLRYAENVIKAEQAMGDAPKKELKKEHKKSEHKEVKEDSSSEEEEKPKKVKEVKEVEKKVKKDIEEVKKHIKKEKGLKPKERDAEHEAEIKALAKIPRALHSAYKKHLKAHDGDHSKAKKELKKTMAEVK